ncbi:hypothetical protein BT63DRAFT_410484 [Microthyrium microscopicum]|uniref:Uncharacterized protein n=1 Tax=Microthyrium microscopicum TaxID=703497 RepID=A0A6A6UPV9_9PEZI|nr:hypothetical protein BT63DRAFT_410484 [Microthyrium microscopicum]
MALQAMPLRFGRTNLRALSLSSSSDLSEESSSSDVPHQFGRQFHNEWKASMETMLTAAYNFRGEMIEDVTDITTFLVECMKEGFRNYEFENDVAGSALSSNDMVLWPDYQTASASVFMAGGFTDCPDAPTLACMVSHGILKTLLGNIENCKGAIGRAALSLPFPSEYQMYLVKSHMPTTCAEILQAGMFKSGLENRWRQLCTKLMTDIETAEKLAQELHVQLSMELGRAKMTFEELSGSAMDRSTEDHRYGVMRLVESYLADTSAGGSVDASQVQGNLDRVLTLYSVCKYSDVFQMAFACTKKLIDDGFFLYWKQSVKAFEATLSG